eukprot:TRINITY_DN21842_c0_g1_i1.p1 TRINITY_DN21842_c0_g1~~TRINITY_DN21842_c0_g1_i1.p1  ORF type:complete len:131 (+),score=12.00 TRINITY_DN21842_c0_g1_i1:93-485(+)
MKTRKKLPAGTTSNPLACDRVYRADKIRNGAHGTTAAAAERLSTAFGHATGCIITSSPKGQEATLRCRALTQKDPAAAGHWTQRRTPCEHDIIALAGFGRRAMQQRSKAEHVCQCRARPPPSPSPELKGA